jgi:hypothetical protein
MTPNAAKLALLDKITRFILNTRVSLDGGWAPVTKVEFETLNGIIQALIDVKWGPDADGDRPINYKLIDRTRFESDHFFLLPYLSRATGHKELLNYISYAATNSGIAQDRLSRAIKVLDLECNADGPDTEDDDPEEKE